jgi:hypothetical protein
MSEKELILTNADYKKHIFKNLERFIDTTSIKEMMFIKMEILSLMDRINHKNIETSGVESVLDNTIDIGKLNQDKDEDFGSLKMFIEKYFFEKI